ncbi:MAG: hypothetical protein M3Q49_06965, partial [Actinomycetota bacterium]|nr:hypothetical protein [Actinomycetota bacterium]
RLHQQRRDLRPFHGPTTSGRSPGKTDLVGAASEAGFRGGALSPTAKNVAALFMRHEEKLDEEQEAAYLGRLCEADEALADTRGLTTQE